MSTLTWDAAGQKIYETGVDRVVLFVSTLTGYGKGVAWNGITNVSDSPSGAEPESGYADNIKYFDIMSAEEVEGSIEAYTYPDEFMACDGFQEIAPGAVIGQQSRSQFAICYRTKVGNDLAGQNFGYKLHFAYGLSASPSEKSYDTINDSPEAVSFSWDYSSTPVSCKYALTGSTSSFTVDSTKTTPEIMKSIEDIVYGTESEDSRLPMPDELAEIVMGGAEEAMAALNRARAAMNPMTVPSLVNAPVSEN